jgi:hypothetical protein
MKRKKAVKKKAVKKKAVKKVKSNPADGYYGGEDCNSRNRYGDDTYSWATEQLKKG